MWHIQQGCSGIRMTPWYITYIGGKKRARWYFEQKIQYLKEKYGKETPCQK